MELCFDAELAYGTRLESAQGRTISSLEPTELPTEMPGHSGPLVFQEQRGGAVALVTHRPHESFGNLTLSQHISYLSLTVPLCRPLNLLLSVASSTEEE